ncbi:MAG: BspA family leucine-rich repeat surface protein [Opitutaceae bacterium]
MKKTLLLLIAAIAHVAFSAINVKDFGATGDGVTDDTAAIESALAEGGDVFIPEGVFIVRSADITKSGTRLYGAGYDSVIRLDPETFLSVETKVLQLGYSGDIPLENVTIENLRIDGSKRAGRATNLEWEGINGRNTVNLTIRNCWIHDCVRDGIDIDGINSGLKILGNHLYDNDGYGIHTYGVSDGDISYNTIQRCGLVWPTAIARPGAIDVISSGARNRVTHNTIIDQHHKGISVATVDSIIDRNFIDGLTDAQSSITLSGARSIASNNIIKDVSGVGIQINAAAADNCIITKNSLFSIGEDAITLAFGVTGTAITGNRVEEADHDTPVIASRSFQWVNELQELYGAQYSFEFILVYDTKLSAGTLVELPLRGTVDCVVDWGDGSSDAYTTTGDKTHTYSAEGKYTVKLSGVLTGFGYGSSPATTAASASKLIEVISFGHTGLTNLMGAFRDCVNLISVPDRILPESVTNISFMFRGCTRFNGDIGEWDVRRITTFSDMFRDGEAFVGTGIGNWKFRDGGTLYAMFFSVDAFDQDLGSWNMAAFDAKNMTYMLTGTGISVANYSATLMGWANQVAALGVPINRSLGTNTLQYDATASDAVTVLTNAGWTNLGTLAP